METNAVPWSFCHWWRVYERGEILVTWSRGVPAPGQLSTAAWDRRAAYVGQGPLLKGRQSPSSLPRGWSCPLRSELGSVWECLQDPSQMGCSWGRNDYRAMTHQTCPQYSRKKIYSWIETTIRQNETWWQVFNRSMPIFSGLTGLCQSFQAWPVYANLFRPDRSMPIFSGLTGLWWSYPGQLRGGTVLLSISLKKIGIDRQGLKKIGENSAISECVSPSSTTSWLSTTESHNSYK